MIFGAFIPKLYRFIGPMYTWGPCAHHLLLHGNSLYGVDTWWDLYSTSLQELVAPSRLQVSFTDLTTLSPHLESGTPHSIWSPLL